MAFGAFCGDFGACAGIPTILLQAQDWGVSPVVANYPNNLAAVMCGVSGILWMPLLNSWGRIPVLFWSTLLGLLFTLGACIAPNYTTYYAMRALQGVTQSTGQTIGLAFVEDMFFFHEHARKIGIWYSIFISSPFYSPLLGNFMIGKLGTWQPVFWLNFAIAAWVLAMIAIFGDETYYNRSVPAEAQRSRPTSQKARITRVLGIWQLQGPKGYSPTVGRAYLRLLEVLTKPIIPLVMLFYSTVFMWCIGINVTSTIILGLPRKLGGYGMGPLTLGYMYFTPIVAVYLGEIFGHWFNDWIAYRYVSRHQGLFVPEVRLWTTYIGAVFMVPGLIIIGQAIEHHLNIGVVIIGWGMFQFGVMVTSVATIAYVLDCYPSASGEVSALINFGRVALGFTVGYFQMDWGLAQGFDVSFGIQAAVVVAAYLLLMIIQTFGGRLRARAGPVSHLAGEANGDINQHGGRSGRLANPSL